MEYLVLCLLLFGVIAEYNTSCKFYLPDKRIYDFSKIHIKGPKDYTYQEADTLYVINFCGPAIKTCNGVEEAFASVWNATTFKCIQTLGEGVITTSYINPQMPSEGIVVEYIGDYVTQLVFQCDQALGRGGVVSVKKSDTYPITYKYLFKSKYACRNFSKGGSTGWSGFTILFVFTFLCVGTYIVVGFCLYHSKNSSVNISSKEYWYSVLFWVKEWANGNLDNYSQANTSSHLPTI